MKSPEPGSTISAGLSNEFGESNVYHDAFSEPGGVFSFPVLDRDGSIVSSTIKSETLANIPLGVVDNVYVNPSYLDRAREWLNGNRDRLLEEASQEREQ